MKILKRRLHNQFPKRFGIIIPLWSKLFVSNAVANIYIIEGQYLIQVKSQIAEQIECVDATAQRAELSVSQIQRFSPNY